MTMTLLEFTVFGLYLLFLIVAMVTVQVVEAKRLQIRVEDTDEKFVETAEEEEEEEEEVTEEGGEEPPFNPEVEPYTMTENPMLRHRVVDQEVDMEAVD